jgi:hypothetical protein
MTGVIGRVDAVVNERRERKRSSFVVRWDAVITVIVAFVVGIVIGMGAQFAVDHAQPQASVPWCTAPIADAGGICHGEPLEACVNEDSADCYWDATRGNGIGRSFVDVGGVVYYQDVTL